MLLSLVKKDFILVKKYVLFMAAVCFLLPVFLLSRLPEFAGPLTYFISVAYTIFLLLQYVFLKEYQSPKASLLLCASPYPRRLMVLGKYGFCLVLYAASSLIYWINTQVFPGLGRFHWEMAVLVFFIVTIFLWSTGWDLKGQNLSLCLSLWLVLLRLPLSFKKERLSKTIFSFCLRCSFTV